MNAGGQYKQCGSLLMEISVALMIAGVLAGISYSAMHSMAEANSRRQVQTAVNAMRSELLEFAARHGRLPCPDLTGSGNEGDASGACTAGANFGGLPYRTLGFDDLPVREQQIFRYGVFRSSNGSDLSNTPATFELSPSLAFRKSALNAVNAETSGQPFVSQTLGDADDCKVNSNVPAFVVAAGVSTALGGGLCFLEPVAKDGAIAYVGRQELAGWLIARARSNAK